LRDTSVYEELLVQKCPKHIDAGSAVSRDRSIIAPWRYMTWYGPAFSCPWRGVPQHDKSGKFENYKCYQIKL